MALRLSQQGYDMVLELSNSIDMSSGQNNSTLELEFKKAEK